MDDQQAGKRKWPNGEDGGAPEHKKSKSTAKRNICPVCLDYMDDEEMIATSCAHLFHTQCILTSYEYTNRCPVCRTCMEELAGYSYEGPQPMGTEMDVETITVPPPGGSTTRRTRGRRANRRSQRAPTPYPSENEAEQQPTQETVTEIGSTGSASCQEASNAVQEDTTYQQEYTPNALSSESSEEDNASGEDTNDADYVPPTCFLCGEVVEVSSSDSDVEDGTLLCPDCRADPYYALNIESGAPLVGNTADSSPAGESSPDSPDADGGEVQDSVANSAAAGTSPRTPKGEDSSPESPAEDSSTEAPVDSSADSQAEEPAPDSPDETSSAASTLAEDARPDSPLCENAPPDSNLVVPIVLPCCPASPEEEDASPDSPAEDSSGESCVTSRYMLNESLSAPSTREPSPAPVEDDDDDDDDL